MRNLRIDWWAMFQMFVVVILGVLLANYISQQVAKGTNNFKLKKAAKTDVTATPETTEKSD